MVRTQSETGAVVPTPGAWLAPSEMSHYRENLLEHVFVAEVLQECAFVREQKVEVLQAEVDEGGYDLVFELGDIIRHVQLKTRFVGRTKKNKNPMPINVKLEEHLGGCVVLMNWQVTAGQNRAALTYRWWGHGPGLETKTLPKLPVYHTRGEKTVRRNMRSLAIGKMEDVPTTAELVKKLFG